MKIKSHFSVVVSCLFALFFAVQTGYSQEIMRARASQGQGLPRYKILDHQGRLNFKGKIGKQMPFKLVEEISFTENAGKVKLSKRNNTSAGNLNFVEEKHTISGGRKSTAFVHIFNGRKNILSSKKFETKRATENRGGKITEYDKIHSYIHKFSKYGKYMITSTNSESKKWGRKYEIFDVMGRKLWEEELELYMDYTLNYYISDQNGITVRILGNIVTFYSPEGDIIIESNYFNNNKIYAFGKGQFSEDGEYFVVNAKEYYGSGETGKTREEESKNVTLCLNKQGQEIWRYQGNSEFGSNQIGISPDNKYVITGERNLGDRRGTALLLDFNGTLLKSYNELSLNDIKFSSDNKYAALKTDGSSRIIVIDMNTFEIIKKYEGGRFLAYDIADNGRLVLVENYNLYVLDINGTPLFGKELDLPDATSNIPQFSVQTQISNDGSEVLVKLVNKLQRFKLQ